VPCLRNHPFRFTDETQEVFDGLKKAVLDTPVLQFPHPSLPCILDTDSSDVAVEAVLSQVINGEERPIAFFSRVLSQTQRAHCATRRELLAVVTATQHFRHYLLGNKTILRTDHHSQVAANFQAARGHAGSLDRDAKRVRLRN